MNCFWHRLLGFLSLWLVISGASAAELAVGLPVAVIAAAVSIRFLPCAPMRLNLRECVVIALRLPYQACAAGLDIALRALHPKPPLRPGFIRYHSQLPEGALQSAFTVLVSMQPGSVPIAVGRDCDFMVHCLDETRPVGDALAADEARLAKAAGLDGPG
jgi:multicomponent Na+:H+ antiporter subunit E